MKAPAPTFSPQDEALLAAAKKARAAAWCPYSKFPVGAALLARDGSIHLGCNVENASYGCTICAERGAVCRAVAEGNRQFKAIAISTEHAEALMPCGVCRQVLAEFSPDLLVLSEGGTGARAKARLKDLLPGAFVPEHLDREGPGEG